MNKIQKMDLQHDFKKKNNKPGSPSGSLKEEQLIKQAKNTVKTTD